MVFNRRWYSPPKGILERRGSIFHFCGNWKLWPAFSGNAMDNPAKRTVVLPQKHRDLKEKIISNRPWTTVRQNGLHVEPQPARVLYDAYHWIIGHNIGVKKNSRRQVLVRESYSMVRKSVAYDQWSPTQSQPWSSIFWTQYLQEQKKKKKRKCLLKTIPPKTVF